jgi:hypothetical protein
MSPDDGETELGIRPVIFDVLAPDQETSILPPDIRMVLHVNPNTMSVQYEKVIERLQTKGGYVEQHWGEGARSIDFTAATGGFKRLYTGLSNITGGAGLDTLGTRRETIAYDKYLDFLALFHNNGSVYDSTGQIVFQGVIKILFDGASFTVKHEILRFRSLPYSSGEAGAKNTPNQNPRERPVHGAVTSLLGLDTPEISSPQVTSLPSGSDGFEGA